MKNYLSLFILAFGFQSLLAQLPIETACYISDPGQVPREQVVDMKHMRLSVSFDPRAGKVFGEVTHFFTPLRKTIDSIFLDGPGIKVLEASLNGNPIRHSSNDSGLVFYPNKTLTWGSSDSLRIRYEATPPKGIYFIGWNDPAAKARKQIWTQGQGTDNRYWIPCYDQLNDKLTTETIIRFDDKYRVLSNGSLVSKVNNNDGTTTWHYRMSKPHTTYLVMVGIGVYDVRESASASGVPMTYWYYPEYADRVDDVYKYSEEMMNFFEKETGVPYPWESYAQIPVADFMYGAMENTTATLFGDFYMIDKRSWNDRNYVGTNAHELAHQWFGDYVTARSAAHHWLQESFATYYSYLFDEHIFGRDYFDWGRRGASQLALQAGTKDALPIAHSNAGTARWYPKGAMVLHMLRYVVGEDQYRAAITHYLQKHPYGNVDSDDLLVAFHERLGMSLNWFWDQWVRRGGEPHYHVTAEEIRNEGGQRQEVFTVSQIQKINDIQPVFSMPIWFSAHYVDGSADSMQVMVSQQTQKIYLPIRENAKVAYVLFDPGSQILKNVTFNKSEAMLREQADMAVHMTDRLDAVIALGDFPFASNHSHYERIMKRDEYFPVKSEIVRQAARQGGKEAEGILKTALKDRDVQVRKSVARYVNTVTPELRTSFEKLLTDSSYETIEWSLTKLSEAFPERRAEYLKLTDDFIGTRGSSIRVRNLEIKSAEGNIEARTELVGLTSVSNEFITRTNAMQALLRLNHLDETLLSHLLDAAYSPNRRLAGPARDALKSYAPETTYRQVIEKGIRGSSFSAAQKEQLRQSIY